MSDDALVACAECARAIAIGWWGGISRHRRADDTAPLCRLCQQGEATLTAEKFMNFTGDLVFEYRARGIGGTWHDDALRGLGLRGDSA
jgi:hypothetical protein